MADPRALRHEKVRLQSEEERLDRELARLLDLELDEGRFPARVRMDPLRLETEQRERAVSFKRRVVKRLKETLEIEPGEVEGPPTTVEEVEGIGPDLAETLREAGIVTVEDLKAADDGELLALPGIGPSKLKRIREEV